MTGLGCQARPLDVVELHGLEVRCVVGVYGHERTRTQALVVGLELHLDLEAAGATDEVARTVDYGRVVGEVRFLLEHARFRLIESAAATVARWLVSPSSADAPRPQVRRAVVRIDKPDALRGLARPSVVLTRDADDGVLPSVVTPFGVVETLHRSREVAVTRVRLSPGAAIAAHRHQGEESELTIGDGLSAQGRPLPWGTAVSWPAGAVHGWHNGSGVEQTLLRVACPPSVDEPAELPVTPALPATTDYAPAGTRS
ncbi:MAG: dihydroneopterin aldolase [Deltaproteobacteria bacterium]|nr:dihydroneopterin aldolase [Deltaproteobacteria bacterium]